MYLLWSLCCFYSVTKLYLILCDLMDSNTPGFSVLSITWSLLKSCPLSWWCYLTILSSVTPFSFCLQFFPASRPFPVSWLFVSGSQSIGVSASASVLPMNIQGWFPLGWLFWTLYSPLSKGLPRQEYRSGLLFPSPGDLPDPEVKPRCSALAGWFFITKPPGKPMDLVTEMLIMGKYLETTNVCIKIAILITVIL